MQTRGLAGWLTSELSDTHAAGMKGVWKERERERERVWRSGQPVKGVDGKASRNEETKIWVEFVIHTAHNKIGQSVC